MHHIVEFHHNLPTTLNQTPKSCEIIYIYI